MVQDRRELLTMEEKKQATGVGLWPIFLIALVWGLLISVNSYGQIVINEIHADPDPVLGDANGDGSVDTIDDEFIELVNNSGADLDISGWTISDGVQVRHTFPASTILVNGQSIVVFGGGTPTGFGPSIITQIASSGTIAANNGGDTFTVTNLSATDVATYMYGSEGGNNQSLTRDPDITGAFVQHSTATGAGGALYSPGSLIDGNPFPIIPILDQTTPTDDAEAVNISTNLVFDFNVDVATDAGDITIKRLADDSDYHTVSITDATQVSIVDNVLTIDPNIALEQGTAYYVTFDPGAIESVWTGDAYPGFNDNTTFDFETNFEPTLVNAIGTIEVLEGQDSTLMLLDLDGNPGDDRFADQEEDANDLTYSLEDAGNPGIVTATLNASNEIVLDIAEDGQGSTNLTIRATDNQGLFAEETFTLNVSAAQIDFQITGTGSGTEDAIGTQTFTITKIGTTFLTESLNLELKGTAANTLDYDNIVGVTGLVDKLDFAPSETEKTVAIDVTADNLVEPEETVILAAQGTSPAESPGNTVFTVTVDEATLTIEDDDVGELSITASGPTGDETGPINGAFTIVSTNPFQSDEDITLLVTGTANPSLGDYTTIAITSFPANQTSLVVPVLVLDDALLEGNETVIATLEASTAMDALATVSATNFEATVTINDDDDAIFTIIPTIAAAAEAGTNGQFTITSSVTTGNPVTIDFDITGTATAGADYTGLGTSFIFPANQTSHTINVVVSDDLIDEEDTESVVMTLTGTDIPIATIGVPNEAEVLITDDDQTVISIDSDFSLNEGTGGANNAPFSVSLSLAVEKTVMVDYSTVDGTALAGEDYTAVSGTLTFDATTAQTQGVDVPITTDNKFEQDQSFSLTLSNPSGATIDAMGQTREATLLNDDGQPQISITGVNVNEGDGTAVLTIALSNPSDEIITVNYQTSSGGAIADSDFVSSAEPVTFLAEEELQTISITIIDDLVDEEDIEAFTVDLSTPANATLMAGAETAMVSIADNDDPPTFTILDIQQAEGNANNDFVFTVDLLGLTERVVTVDYTVTTGTGSATAGVDFQEIGLTTLTFTPPQTSQQVAVTVFGDFLDEDDETFVLTLSNPSNAFIATEAEFTTATIEDDDPLPIISVIDGQINEGNALTQLLDFAVSLNTVSGREVRVNYQVSDQTATVGSGDYEALAPGEIIIPAGETTASVSVMALDDNIDEEDEQLLMNLSNPVNVEINPSAGVGTGTIIDDDPEPQISIADAVTVEGASGATTAMNFILSLSNPSSKAISIEYTTFNLTAVAGSDYQGASGVLNLTPLALEATLTVNVTGDDILELDETFQVNFSNPQNASLVNVSAIGTIENDDPGPVLSVEDVQVDEGSGFATFTARLSYASSLPATFTYATQDNTAQAFSGDYNPINPLPITFNPTEVEKVIRIAINDDSTDEEDEDFSIVFSNPNNVEIPDTEAVATILDNDDPPQLFISDATVVEGSDDAPPAMLMVSLSIASGKTITVDYSTQDNTAIANQDYLPQANLRLTFDPGTTIQNAVIPILGGNETEPEESFFVNLSNATNATIQDGQGEATIIDDDVVIISVEQDFYTTEEERILQVPAPGVLENDEVTTDGELTAVLVETTPNGILNLMPDGGIIYNPNLNFSGIDVFTYRARSAGVNSAVTTVSISVTPVNDPPSIGALADLEMFENTSQGPIKFDIDDIDTPGDALVLSAVSSNLDLFPQGSLLLESNGADGFITLTPAMDQIGSATITITVSDGEFTASTMFQVNVIDDNRPPRGITLSRNIVDSNADPGSTIGFFTVEDDADDLHNLILVGGPGSEHNDLFLIIGDSLLVGASFSPEGLEVLSIAVSATDQDGESITVTFLIEVNYPETSEQIFMPTLFSPNDDGSNDLFIVRSESIATISFRIFNRQGQLLYETSDVSEATSQGWDGTHNGRQQPGGTYVWQISGTLRDGNPISFEGKNFGNVTLIR